MARAAILGLLAVLLSAALQLCTAFSSAGPSFEVTQYFSLAANSTCGGDPPTLFQDQFNGGIANCSVGEHDPQLAADGDPNTWWQSSNGDTPVELVFSLEQASLALVPAGVRLQLRSAPPLLLLVELQLASGGEASLVQVFASDVGSCDPFVAQDTPCSQFIIEGPDIIVCPLDSSEPVSQLTLTAVGFQPTLIADERYFAIQEASIYGWVAPGYYVPSVQAISVEGETGILMAPQSIVAVGSSEGELPGFTGQGYAVLEFTSSEREIVQWVFPSLPRASTYQLVLRYANIGVPTSSQAPMVTIMQGSQMFTPRFIIEPSCVPPCHASSMFPDIMDGQLGFRLAEFDLSEGPVTVTMELSAIGILVDSIIAVPVEFYDPSTLADPSRFIQNCGVISGTLGTGTEEELFCLTSAVQLSAEFYGATFGCNCDSGQVCEVAGGQCPCDAPAAGFDPTRGRRCNLCLFYTYLTPDGCAACDCVDPLDDCGRTGANGQCTCPPLVTGRTCDACFPNTFGDPFDPMGCEPCSCNLTGTEVCDSTTAQCICREGVTGDTCDTCEDGTFNFSSTGCEGCGCDSVGSESANCNDSGQCLCRAGVGGLKCSDCLDGFYFVSSSGCTPCNCSGRTSDCQQDPSNTMEPQEVCQCPAPYVGPSCEACEAGYFLSEVTGDCELCQCNGRASACLDGSGVCINCSGNSTGVQCELCVEGYYDSDPGPTLNCMPCPCTTSTATNTSCVPDPSGSPLCYCRPGHSGPLCDSCSDGFFGQPPTCSQCDCNGNIDPDTPGSCDMTTGQCLICINNSTGPLCESCDSGFFGDATQQNCQPCDCFPGGLNSSSSVCDPSSGQCSCLPGVNGQSCTQCQPGFWNFTATVGCQECACNEVGSSSNVCDPETGACSCQPGVGGLNCSSCLEGYFNFTAEGCTLCGCNDMGSINSSCNPLGECNCQPGVEGTKCDSCQPFHFNLSSSGCQPCGECEQTLLDRLRDVNSILEGVVNDTELLADLTEADMTGLGEVYTTNVEIAANVTASEEYLDALKGQLQALNTSVISTTTNTQSTADQINALLIRTGEIQPFAEEVSAHIQNVYNDLQAVLVDVGPINASLTALENRLREQAVLAAGLASNVTGIASQHEGNFTEAIGLVEVTLAEAQRVSRDIVLLLMQAKAYRGEAGRLVIAYEQIIANLSLIAENADISEQQLVEVRRRKDYAVAVSLQLESVAASIRSILVLATTTIENAEDLLMQTQGFIMLIRDDIDVLKMLIGEEVVFSGSGLSSGLGLGSGSGMGPVSPPLPEPVETILEGVALLRSVVGGLKSTLAECTAVVAMAELHAGELEQQAADIQRTLNASLSTGSAAIAAIVDFSDTIVIVEQALNISMDTNVTLQALLEKAGQLEVGQLQSQAAALLNQSQTLSEVAEQLSSDVQALLPSIPITEAQVALAENQSLAAGDLAASLNQQLQVLRMAADMTLSAVSTTLDNVGSQLQVVNTSYDKIASTAPALLRNISESQQLLESAQQNYTSADSALDAANASAQAALQATRDRLALISNITLEGTGNVQQLEALNSSLGGLRRQLLLAREAAALIDVALRFHGNATLGYELTGSSPLANDSVLLSLYFRPSDTTAGLMLHSEDTGGRSLGVGLNNASVVFQFDTGMGPTVLSSPAVIQQEQWYQIYATREGSVGQLSVAPLQGGSTYTVTQAASPSTSSNGTFSTIYLGGLPEVAQASPVVSENYVGCLDRIVVGNTQLPLLLPDQGRESVATCGPRPPLEPPRAFEDGAWLYGGGSFLQLSFPQPSPGLQVELAFRTFSSEALLLLAYNAELTQSFTIFLTGGRLVMEFALSSLGSMARAETTEVYNDGGFYYITAELDGRNGSLTINSSETVTVSSTGIGSSFNSTGPVFIGGLPAQMQIINERPMPSLAGCLRGLQLNGAPVALEDSSALNRVQFGGCPAEVSPGVRFMGEGLAEFTATDVQLSNVSFAFRSTQLAALLLQAGSELVISLHHTRVRVSHPDGLLESAQDELNDNLWHVVAVTGDNSSLTLMVDGDSVSTLTLSPLTITPGTLLVGGTTNPSSTTTAKSFRGCMDDLVLNGRPIDFNDAQSLEGVALYGCPPPGATVPITPPPPPLPPPPSVRPNVTVGLSGAPGSFIAVEVTEARVANNFDIALEFQTISSSALVLYMQGMAAMFADYMALELRGGQLYFSYNLGSGRAFIVSTGTYDNGFLHRVELSRSGVFGNMTIDGGAEMVSGSSPGNFTALNANSNLLFVGGVPTEIIADQDLSLLFPGDPRPPSTFACYHALSINGRFIDLSVPQASSGVGTCLQSYTNMATFNGSGFLQILDNFLSGVSFGFSLEFRSTSSPCSGLLVYVASVLHADHALLELAEGTVRFVFDNGPGSVEVVYIPSDPLALCDGQWHYVRAEKNGVIGTLQVDQNAAISQSSPFTSFRAINTNDPLFIGGVPDTVGLRSTVSAGPFVGCLNDLQLIDSTGEAESLLFAQATQSSNVTLYTCQL